MHIVPTQSNIRVRAREHPSQEHRQVLLCFSGVNHGMGGMAMQRPEFFRAGDRFDNMLFIDDLDRSWGNNIDFAALFDSLGDYIAGRTVCALGNSMGGNNAIIASNFTTLDTCLAIVPRYSVKPELCPPDTWDRPYLDAISEWRFETIVDQFNATTRYIVISGSSGSEAAHTHLFPVQKNLSHYVLTPTNHGLALTLKKEGTLPDVVAASWGDEMSAAWLARTTGRQVTVLSGPDMTLRQRLRSLLRK